MKIFLGADHAGWELKEEIKSQLEKQGWSLEDLSHSVFDPQDDYPAIAFRVAEKVKETKEARGILICGSGIGMAISANKIKGIRAAKISSPEEAFFARQHNDLNVLCLAGRKWRGKLQEKSWEAQGEFQPVTWKEVERIVHFFLHVPFARGRHQRRVNQILQYESSFSPEGREKQNK